MGISFENPPLVELVAELRWGIPPVIAPATQPAGFVVPLPTMPATHVEEFFVRFASRVEADGFGHVERLIPPGIPLLPFQPVYRFKRTTEKAGTVLYQLGPGIFSANITPPYQSWASFQPILARGVELLLDCRDEKEKQALFNTANVRYINAFKTDLTQSRSIGAFMSEILGIEIRLPAVLEKQRAVGSEIKPGLHLTIPDASNQQMALVIGEGLVNTEPAIILDITVSATREVPAEREAILEVLNTAHDLIHETFVGLTGKLHPLMKPHST